MPRPPASTDVFHAIAEPRRRRIVEALADGGPMAVGELVAVLDLAQPAVSKHLAVLRDVGLVAATRRGRQRLYRLRPEELEPVRDWVRTFERYWENTLDRIKARAEQRAADGKPPPPAAPPGRGR